MQIIVLYLLIFTARVFPKYYELIQGIVLEKNP